FAMGLPPKVGWSCFEQRSGATWNAMAAASLTRRAVRLAAGRGERGLTHDLPDFRGRFRPCSRSRPAPWARRPHAASARGRSFAPLCLRPPALLPAAAGLPLATAPRWSARLHLGAGHSPRSATLINQFGPLGTGKKLCPQPKSLKRRAAPPF